MEYRRRNDRPGYQGRKRSDGSVAHYWNPKRASSKAPSGLPVRPIPDGTSEEEIAIFCQRWTDELVNDLHVMESGSAFNGTISSLIRIYRTDAESPFHKIKHSTRIRDYEPSLRLIDATVGSRKISLLKGDDFRRWYREWAEGGHVRRAHGAIRKLRTALSYGVQQRLEGCSVAREILSLIEFEAPTARRIKMEYAHAKAIVDAALSAVPPRPSIAFTQALQWDTGLRRIHIIGEWVPMEDPGLSSITQNTTKWLGVKASDVVDSVLTVPVTSRHKEASRHDLSKCELVQYIVAKGHELPKVGPLIVSETTGLPYRENYYWADWRVLADSAKVPKDVWSMDARAGAISEAEETSGLDAARKMAAHSNSKTTLGYVRNDDLDNNRKVAEARAQKRALKRP